MCVLLSPRRPLRISDASARFPSSRPRFSFRALSCLFVANEASSAFPLRLALASLASWRFKETAISYESSILGQGQRVTDVWQQATCD